MMDPNRDVIANKIAEEKVRRGKVREGSNVTRFL